jgi:hypothetical protein
MQQAYDDDQVVDALIAFILEIDRFPTSAELRLRRREDSSFPSRGVFSRLGRKGDLARLVVDRCEALDTHARAVEIARPFAEVPPPDAPSAEQPSETGFVYLIKAGPYYKIGRTNSIGRREYELAIQLPEKPEVLHLIETDDPTGVEAYWHNRFANRRTRGEWFDLSRADIRAFRRWKKIV